MHARLWGLVIISSIVSLSANAGCFDDLIRLPAVNKFWKSKDKVEMPTRHGSRHVTFGFDGELWKPVDSISIIENSDAALEMLGKTFRRKGFTYTGYNLDTMMNLPAGRYGEYLREGAPEAFNISHYGYNSNFRYTLADLTLDGLSRIPHDENLKDRIATSLKGPLNKSLEERNIPVTAKIDRLSGMERNRGVELVQKGVKDTPADFMKVIDDFLYTETEEPQTHYHLGFPSGAVSSKQLMLMARALEARIILDELLYEVEYEPGDSYYPDDISAIGTPVSDANVARGVVRAESSRWKKPFAAHDVEIRQWMDRDHAKEMMHFMIELGLNAKRLRDTSSFDGTYIQELNPSNLQNTLKYMDHLLRSRVKERQKPYLDKLVAEAKKIDETKDVTEAQRKKIRQIIYQGDLYDSLQLETFMRKPGEQ